MNRLINMLEELGLSFKKEVIKFAIINVFFLAMALLIFFFKLELYFFLVLGALLFVGDYLFILSYSVRYRNYIESHDDEMITLFSYFQVFLANHEPVYVAFKSLIDYSSNWMKEKIERLLKDIDEDKTVLPFVNFSKNFSNMVYESLCISIFQMIDEGESLEKINEFTFLFNEANEANRQLKKAKKKRSLDVLSSLPLFGAGMITIVLTLSIISSIGDMINVF